MLHGTLDDLAAFACVARLRNFTRAAAELGMSTSNLSHTVRRLEQRLGARLLQRNSRSVAPSEAGMALLETLGPALQGIEGALDALDRKRDAVTGTVRITATRQAYDRVIRPLLSRFATSHPDAGVEVLIEYGYRDIIADGFDAGIRLGEKLQADMVALKVSPELRVAVVAAPAYLEAHSAPADPRALAAHRCINYRAVGSSAIYAWEFGRGDHAFEMRVSGPLTFNEPALMLECALDGLGIAYVLEHEAAPFLLTGRLVRLLEDWTPPFPGFFLYYPSRRQVRPVFGAFIRALRDGREAWSAGPSDDRL